MPTELHSYLCSYCGNMFEAPAGSVDRTREIRGTCCSGVWSDSDIEMRLRWMTA